MKYLEIEQGSQEWRDLKVKKVGGARFGQATSSRENNLVCEMVGEALDGCISQDDYISEDMQFGIDNEEPAIDLYEQKTGLKFDRGGVIMSDFSDIHMASPDGITQDRKIVVEVKCTQLNHVHLKRFVSGIDSKYLPQCINYFAVSDDVEEVHFVSYCPFRQERPIVAIILKRDTVIAIKETKTATIKTTVQDKVIEGRALLLPIEKEVNELIESFTKVDF